MSYTSRHFGHKTGDSRAPIYVLIAGLVAAGVVAGYRWWRGLPR